jgi:hypothetical protein
MTPEVWAHVFDVASAFIVAGVSIGFVAAVLAAAQSH